MYQRLREKGWSREEIEHLKKKDFSIDKEHIGFVIGGIIMLLVSSIGISWAWGLLGMMLAQAVFLFALVFIAIPVGVMFGLLMSDYDHLEKHHHMVLLIVVPVVAVTGSALAFARINATAPSGAFTHNALIAGLAYGFALVVPYAITVIHAWNFRIGSSNT